MIILIKSDHTIGVHASLKKFAELEVNRILGRFATSLTRVKVHLNDVDSIKTGQLDKRCLVEARPAGSGPRIASARASNVKSAIVDALEKMERSLTKSFGKKGWTAAAGSEPAPPAVKSAAHKRVGKKAAFQEKINSRSWNPKKNRENAGRRTWPVK
jgi:ribosome-associated translation inhibitor RaiA